MNAQDLMVGDLVRVSKDVCIEKGAIVRVHAIDGDNNFPEKGLKGCVTCVRINDPDRMSGGVWAEYLEPVPLTDEILQKHFPDTTDGVIWHPTNNPGKYEIIIPHKADRGETSCYINYVHELQQILKICGIKKDIEL